MSAQYITIILHLLGAVVAGGVIGLERSYHGRPAGFRTHTLVCMASSLLMLVTIYQSNWFLVAAADTVHVDPTRMAQGIMTGIGFLGAGVIFKESLSVRGLTTAASIWMTAAIGILIGVGLYFAATVATILTLGTLSIFRWIEQRMPMFFYAQHIVRFARESIIPESEFRKIIEEHGFTIANLSYKLEDKRKYFEYRMVIRTSNNDNVKVLSETLLELDQVLEFKISPTGD